MAQFYNLLQSICVLVALILCAIWLKRRSVISEADQSVFGRLVTDFALPALIFANLARSPLFTPEKMLPALMMFISISVVMILVWIIGKLMRLEQGILGSLVLVAGIGSASTLGYSLIQQVFVHNSTALGDALIIGELGVGLPLFTLGVAVAMYFGRDKSEGRGLWAASKQFFYSPIFISLVLGIAVSFLNVPQAHWAVRLIYKFLEIAGDSLSLLVAFTIGLMLRPINFRTTWLLIALVAIVKLIVEPLLAGLGASMLAVPGLEREVLVLEAAMPSGTVAAVLAARYGCDGAAASSLVIATYLFSLVTLPLIFLIGS